MNYKSFSALVLGCALAAGPALSALADEPVISYTNEHTVLTSLDVTCAPTDIIETGDGALLVTDEYAKVIWQIRDGVCTLYAGSTSTIDPYGEPLGGYNDARHDESLFKDPWAISPFLEGWAISDADNDAVRVLRADRTETANATTNEPLKMGNMGVIFDHPTGLATDERGYLYVSDTGNNAVRVISPSGNGQSVIKRLNRPTDLDWHDGWLYIAETGANRILRVKDGKAEYLAGSGENGFADGPADSAAFSSPQGIAVGPDGTVYVSDTVNGAVRRIRNGTVDTLLMPDPVNPRAYPVSPAGLCVFGDSLYVCDPYSRKLFIISL